MTKAIKRCKKAASRAVRNLLKNKDIVGIEKGIYTSNSMKHPFYNINIWMENGYGGNWSVIGPNGGYMFDKFGRIRKRPLKKHITKYKRDEKGRLMPLGCI